MPLSQDPSSAPQTPPGSSGEPRTVERHPERFPEQGPARDVGGLVGEERPDSPQPDHAEGGDQHVRGELPHGEQQPGEQRSHRSTVTAAERAYFAAVGVLAAWVGVPAYLAPAQVDAVLPFAVPLLHARLIGAMYLSGLAIMVGGLLARRWAEIRVVPVITAIWTGGLLLVTLMHLEEFDFTTTQTRIWFGAYLAYPLIGTWIQVRRRGDGIADEPGSVLAVWTRRCLTGQGVVLSAVGLTLLLASGPMAAGWPWPVTPLLAQIYSAPLLAYGIGSLLLARARTWRETRIGVVGIGLFALAALAASVIHRELFAAADPAAWAWFGVLAVLTAVAALLVVSPRRT